MLLPKGIVINTANIYDEVATYPTVPADRVWEFWHVYTTTNKRLKDPTACRLENFWWHVWGSDRRLLSGQTLARLYEHISDGPTIAPLQGPPNRWEGPDAQLVTRQVVMAHLNSERDGCQPSRPPPPVERPSDTSIKSLPSPSASRPPAPHPILKKTRGPSSSGGPRPTARVVSPHDSPDEAVDKDGELGSSSGTVITVVDRPATAPKKKPSAAGKKFVVASSTAKRRPVLPRRTSSQATVPTAGAEVAESSRDGNLTTGPRAAGQQQRPVSPIPERTTTARSQEVGDAADKAPPAPSAKALGKRPALTPSMAADRRGKSGARSLSSTSLEGRSSTARLKTSVPRARSFVGDAKPPKVTRTVSDTAEAASVVRRPAVMNRAQSSHGDYGRGSDARSISQGLFTGATASTTNVAAQGTIIDQAGSLPTSSIMDTRFNDFSLPSTSVLDSRLTPTQPDPSPRVPMARTRSQLTLLLEREKERTADRSRSKG
ncbi:hypothetical protein XA68_16725 [Ophiocordyceps unilateralis]|uniref:Nitrogen regulatory protein areA GATA-like domain-containing protein n=1 Tax=Ophiocordyceps unilateralis TaxID=268505 RepID=A0A2A9P622_OPHUN|nr:hypothetical protein XA68_16725 [Ophiocordyceps unilateralis]